MREHTQRNAKNVLVAAALTAAILQTTQADASYWVKINGGYAHTYYGDYAGGVDSDDATQNTGNVTATSVDWYAHPTASGAHGSSWSEVSVTSDLGHVYGSVRAQSLVDIDDTTGTTTQATGTFQGAWNEMFTVTSPSLPYGTPVDIAFRLRLDSVINSQGPFDTDNVVRADLVISGGGVLTLDRASTSGAQSLYDSTVLSYPVGSQFTVEGWMTLTGLTGATSIGSNKVFENGLELLAENSAGFGIEVVTPQAGYSTSSGITYPTHPVPEPSAFALLSVAALGLLAYGWRRRR